MRYGAFNVWRVRLLIINCNKCAIFNAVFDIKNIEKLLIN